MIDLEIVTILAWFIGNAFIGGFAYTLLHIHKGYKRTARHITLAIIAGYMYFCLYHSYHLPDGFVAFPIGWFAPSFIENLMDRFEPNHKDKGGTKHG